MALTTGGAAAQPIGPAAKLFFEGLRKAKAANQIMRLAEIVQPTAPSLAVALRALDARTPQFFEAAVAASIDDSPSAGTAGGTVPQDVRALAEALEEVVAAGQGAALARIVADLPATSGASSDLAPFFQEMDSSTARLIGVAGEKAVAQTRGLVGGRTFHAEVDICDFYAHVELMCAVQEIVQRLSADDLAGSRDPVMESRLLYAREQLSRRWTFVDRTFEAADCAGTGDACACLEAVRKRSGHCPAP